MLKVLQSSKGSLTGLLAHLTPQRIYRWFFPLRPHGGLATKVQGDVLLGLQKRHEAFLIFHIDDVDGFKRVLRSHVLDKITSTADVVKAAEEIERYRVSHADGFLEHIRGLNLSFSAMGLAKLGVDVAAAFPDDIAFRVGRRVDGIFLLTAASKHALDKAVGKLLKRLSHTISLVRRKDGTVRPGRQAAHEHFGFLDGVTRPTVVGFNDQHRAPGETASPADVFILPASQDWRGNGSFLVVRELQQKVPEFETWCEDMAKSVKPCPVHPNLIAARMVGRWQNGVPLVMSPTLEQGNLASDIRLREDFDFSGDLLGEACPYVAHIRKANPRQGSSASLATVQHRVLRSGIAYGPEVGEQEKRKGKTEHDRGLFFVCYQSSIENGFRFIQQSWLNSPRIPVDNAVGSVEPGCDLIAGQRLSEKGGLRTAQGLLPGSPTSPGDKVAVPSFVVPRGGEYFFTPSLDGLKHLANYPTGTLIT
ncbi:dye-decolorizing heme-containing peroxidase [Rhodosporidiobolus nylandii]